MRSRLKSMQLLHKTFLLLGCILGLSPVQNWGAPPNLPDSLFIGVCSQITRESKLYDPFSVHEEMLDAINHANLNFTRTGFKWRVIHPSQTEWDWRITDAIVASARVKKVKILALLGSMPDGFAEAPETYHGLWVEFVDSVTTRYAEDIFHWELWNEPNGRSGKYWPQDASPETFATFIIEAGNIIRENQPNATILLGGLTTGQKTMPFEFWTSLFESGVLEVVDGIAYHPYHYTGVNLIDFNQRLTSLIAKYTSEKKQFWITEYGLPAVDSDKFPNFTFDQQSKSILKSILVHWATGGTKFFIYNLWDKAEFDSNSNEKDFRKNRNYYFGLLENNMSPKPSYIAVKWLAGLLKDYEPLNIQSGNDGVLIQVKHKETGKLGYFTWGGKAHEDLYKRHKEATLTECQSSQVPLKLNKLKSSDLKTQAENVLFWQ